MLYILAFFAVAAFAQTADLAIANARIYTLNPACPAASAIAVAGGKILAMGDDTTRYIGLSTRKFDGEGEVIWPE